MYELRQGALRLTVDPESGPTEFSVLAPMAEAIVAWRTWAVTPTGPFLPVSWADPGLLAAAMTAKDPDNPTTAHDESGAEIPFTIPDIGGAPEGLDINF